MGSARKRRRLVAFRKQAVQDETMNRFTWLVGGVIAFEIAVLFWVLSSYGYIIRPLG